MVRMGGGAEVYDALGLNQLAGAIRNLRAEYERRVAANRCAWAWEISDYSLLLLATGHANVPMEDWT